MSGRLFQMSLRPSSSKSTAKLTNDDGIYAPGLLALERELKKLGEVLVVAPATANTLANFAQGRAPDFLSTVYLAFPGSVILAPAMNAQMWKHPAVQENLRVLRSRDALVIDPQEGELACGEVGPGRMAERCPRPATPPRRVARNTSWDSQPAAAVRDARRGSA